MKIKLDENLPASLVVTLSALGHDADTVISEGLAAHSDADVWQASQVAQRLLITQDLDFSDVRHFGPGTHHGILLIQLHHPSRTLLTKRILHIFQSQDVESWKRCFVTVTDHKIRVRRPPA